MLWKVWIACVDPQCSEKLMLITNHSRTRLLVADSSSEPGECEKRKQRRYQRRLRAAAKGSPERKQERTEAAERMHSIESGIPLRSGGGRGVLEINMRVAAAVLLAGLRHTGYDDFGKIASLHVLPPRTLTSLAPRVWEAAKTVALRKMAHRLRSRTWLTIRLSMDGSWSQRREANHHCFVILDAIDNKPLCIIPLSKPQWGVGKDQKPVLRRAGNYDGGHSNGMEASAWQFAADVLNDIEPNMCKRVSIICCDQDSKAPHLAAKLFTNATVVHDAGHYFKNVMKRLKTAFGARKGVDGIPIRVMQALNRIRHSALQAANANRPVPTDPPAAAPPDLLHVNRIRAKLDMPLLARPFQPPSSGTPTAAVPSMQPAAETAASSVDAKQQEDSAAVQARVSRLLEEEGLLVERSEPVQESDAARAAKKKKAEKLTREQKKQEVKRAKTTAATADSKRSAPEHVTAPDRDPAITLAIDHFLYMLSFFYWHYTQNTCALGCPFAHGHGAVAVELADEIQAPIVPIDEQDAGVLRDESEDESPAIVVRRRRRGPLVVDDEAVDNESVLSGSLSLSSSSSSSSSSSHSSSSSSSSASNSSSSSGKTSHGGGAGRRSSLSWSKGNDDSGKKWIPLADAEATLCLLQCIDQIRIDVAKIIHPYNTCHVEGFHDLR